MREIFCRGKRIDNGEWVYGFYVFEKKRLGKFGQIITEADFERHLIVRPNREFFEVDPHTIGQYTGLTANGKKVFEGDIILFEDESPSNYEYHDCTEMRCGEIKFDDGEFYLTNRIAVSMGDLIYDGKLDGTIVGNIHDNPELLKGE